MSSMVLRKSIEVPCEINDAFLLFTDGIATWWPLSSHSVGEERAVSCAIEGRVGGRFYETLETGDIEIWGTVTLWEPPDTLAFTWHPGRHPSTAQRVTIRFVPIEGGTRVDLEHRGWEVLGDAAESSYAGYDEGWTFVLGRFAESSKSHTAGSAAA